MSSESVPFLIRPIDRKSDHEVELVAARMRQTLVEVLGEERGGGMYTMDWLIARARFHLNQEACMGEILVAESSAGDNIGHTILRREQEDEGGGPYGVFSTIYVVPTHRRFGVASALIESGQEWFGGRGLSEFRTYTDEDNLPLIRLFEGKGFAVVEKRNAFAVLVKRL